jgi:hypothetical protein
MNRVKHHRESQKEQKENSGTGEPRAARDLVNESEPSEVGLERATEVKQGRGLTLAVTIYRMADLTSWEIVTGTYGLREEAHYPADLPFILSLGSLLLTQHSTDLYIDILLFILLLFSLLFFLLLCSLFRCAVPQHCRGIKCMIAKLTKTLFTSNIGKHQWRLVKLCWYFSASIPCEKAL